MKIFLILLAIYVAQILIGGIYPYYHYRRDYRHRTIEGFMYYMTDHDMEYFKFIMFFPYLGIIACIIAWVITTIMTFFTWLYRNFIKNIKI